MPEPALRFLEYVFLALLYLFFLRVVRAVWVELREPRLVAASPANEEGRAAPSSTTGPRRGRGPKLKLVVLTPGQSYPAVVPLGDEMTIGRAAGCAVPLVEDNFVSQLHARVFRQGDDLWVEDLGSTNGTLVNGRKISAAAPLRRGDRIQVGRSVMELQR